MLIFARKESNLVAYNMIATLSDSHRNCSIAVWRSQTFSYSNIDKIRLNQLLKLQYYHLPGAARELYRSTNSGPQRPIACGDHFFRLVVRERDRLKISIQVLILTKKNLTR